MEAVVGDHAVGAVRDEQAHVVPREPARLRRLVRLQAARQFEGGLTHVAAPTSSRAR